MRGVTGKAGDGGELTSVKVCWACFCYVIVSFGTQEGVQREIAKTEDSDDTYHVALAFKEGADRVVQLLYGNRHAGAEIGAFALTKWPSPRLAGMKGWSREGGRGAEGN